MRRLFLLFCILFIVICVGLRFHTPQVTQRFVGEFIAKSYNQVYTPEVENRYNEIVFVGDVMLARQVETFMDTYGSDYPYTSLPPHASTSYLIGNFESAIPKKHIQTPSLGFVFSTEEKHIPALIDYGFTHLGLANNHAFDYGPSGFVNANDVLRKASSTPFGNPSFFSSASAVYLEVGTTTVAVLALYALDVRPTQEELEAVLQDIATQSDMQIVYVHWGTEYALTHNAFQETLAQELVDAGADVIIGHHPHVVQDVAIYKNTPIFYSLGNFIFDQYFSSDVQEGLMVHMKKSNEGWWYTLVPVSTLDSKTVPYVMQPSEKALFLEALAERSDVALTQMITSGSLFIQ